MSELTKQALLVENNQSFPNNNAGLITPSALRTFNEDMIDSNVNQIVYTADSASFDTRIDALSGSIAVDTGSLLTTASFDSGSRNLTFTKGDSSTFAVNIPDASGSVLPSGVVSGSSQIDYPQISNIPSGIVSGSSQVSYTGLSNIPSGIVSGAAQITPLLPSGTISGSAQVVSALPAGTVSGSSQIILQDTTGLLSGSRIDGAVALATNSTYAQNTITTGKNLHNTTIAKGTPLFFTGSGTSGNLVGVFPADAGNPDRMPAGGIAGESLAIGSEGIVLLDGYISGVDTSVFASGDEIFVAVGGGYTNQAPTGSALIQHLGNVEKSAVNGSGVIQMMGEVRGLPNIQQGYIWVGDSNGVPQAVASSSIQTILPSGIVSSSQQITDLGFVSSSITGSSLVTASFASQTLTFTKGDGSTFDLTIPDVSGSDISSLNAFTASQELLNSTFATTSSFNSFTESVDGRLDNIELTTASLQSEVDNLQSVTGSYATTGSNTFVGNQTISGSTTITGELNTTPALLPNTFPGGLERFNLPILSGSNNTIAVDVDNSLYWVPIQNTLNISSSIANIVLSQNQISFTNASTNNSSLFPTYLRNTAETGRFIGISGKPSLTFLTGLSTTNPSIIIQSGSAAVAYYTPIEFQASQSFTDGRVTFTRNVAMLENLEITGSLTASLQQGYVWVGNSLGRTTTVSTSSFGGGGTDISSLNAFTASQELINTGYNSFTQSADSRLNNIELTTASLQGEIDSLQSVTASYATTGSNTFIGDQVITGSVDISGTLTSSLQQGYVWVGDVNGRTTTVSTGSFGGGGSAFPFTGDAQISGSLGVTGSMSGFVNTLSVSSQTASVNFNDGNMFVITLPTGSVTHFTPSNIKAGQTINIQISQAASATTGSVQFSPNVLFAGGNDYQATATGSAIDLLTFVSLDGTNVLGTSIKNFL